MNQSRRDRLYNVILVCTLGLLSLTGSSCHQSSEPFRLMGEAQGSYYSITYYDEQHRDLQQAIDSLLTEFDQTASLWVENSLLRRINCNNDSIVNDLFADLLGKSNYINRITEGCFDCSIGKLVKAWGFGFEKRAEMSQHLIDSLQQYCGQEVTLRTNEEGDLVVCKPSPETEIDFNAIAQGYSVDMVGQFLERKGIHNYIIDIGGEVLARGCKADGSNWSVGIERPATDRYSAREIETVISLNNLAVVTSGNYRKYYEKDGIRYSHTIDPATGRPVEHTLLSVSVVDSTAWRADALATAFMVMGLERSLSFLESHRDEIGTDAVFFIYNENGKYKTYSTPAFADLEKK